MSVSPSLAKGKQTAAFVLVLLSGIGMLAIGSTVLISILGLSDLDIIKITGRFTMLGWIRPVLLTTLILNIVLSIGALIAATMLYYQVQQHHRWGIVILIISTVNFFVLLNTWAMTIFGIGGLLASLLGVIGALLALTERSQT